MWQGIHGHDEVVERFRRNLSAGRLASTYLFVGPAGIGKRTLALELARALLCEVGGAELAPCGTCESCRLAQAGTHPDLLLVAKPAGKSSIPVELFIGPQERRMREGLCHDIALKPFLGGRRVAIIDDADDLNQEGANALLKTLEEPPPHSVLILIGASTARQLPTIRSRCQIVRFRPLAEDAVVELLLANDGAENREHAQRLATTGEGSLERAIQMGDESLWQFREQFLSQLAAAGLDSVRLAQSVAAFVEEAGREASDRRARLRLVIGFAAELYRAAMRAGCGTAAADGAGFDELISKMAPPHPLADPETAAACLERCLDALEQVDRNANQANVIECWLDDIARTMAGRAFVTG